jgi:serine/threonine-protein kinase 24/25/MST4
MAKVAQAWAHLDEVDPHGEFMLLKAMVDRLKGDSRLASALGIAVTPPAPKRHDTKDSGISMGGTTVHGTGTTRIRSNTGGADPIPIIKTPQDAHDSPARTPLQTPFARPDSRPASAASSSPFKGPRLVLAQNNPHLKSHRRRQSAIVGGEKLWAGERQYDEIDEKKLPGHVEKGMEQQGLLADILYGQWISGLKSRWPLT